MNYRMLFPLLFITSFLTANDKDLNAEILKFARENLGKQVDRGECWDVAATPLNEFGAEWDHAIIFGRLVANGTAEGLALVKGEKIKAGDIIQFYRVEIKEVFPDGGWQSQTLGMPDHTAIIEKVLADRKFTLLHQNLSGNRTVQRTELNLKSMQSGKYMIYRPYKKGE